MNAKVNVDHLYKVFGDRPEEAIRRAEAGASKDMIMNETGQVLALRDISFSVAEGEIFVIMGLSGSGKSTLLRCINRLQEPTRGTLTVGDTDVRSLNDQELRTFRRTTFGMVFQHFGLFPHRSVLENVTFGLEIQGVDRSTRERTGREALSVVGLEQWADRQTGSLSGGMQQRVGLARALAIDPQILLMDEPFSALDPLIRTKLQDELLRLHGTMGKTILFVTHDLNEAIKVGDKIGIVNSEGVMVQIGPPEEIILKPADEYVREFLGDIDRPAVIRLETVMRPAHTAPEEAHAQINKTRPIKEALPYVIGTDKPVVITDEHDTVCGTVSYQEIVPFLKQ